MKRLQESCHVIVHYRAFGDDQVFTYRRPYTENILEEIFEELNRGSGKEHPILEGKRSLSVDDEVSIVMSNAQAHITRWRCMSVGWARLDPASTE